MGMVIMTKRMETFWQGDIGRHFSFCLHGDMATPLWGGVANVSLSVGARDMSP